MSVEQTIIDGLIEDCNALKAQIGHLRESMQSVLDTSGFKCSIAGMETVLNKTPQHCLANVMADEIMKAVKLIKPTVKNIDEISAGFNEYCEAVHEFELYAQQLRDNAK